MKTNNEQNTQKVVPKAKVKTKAEKDAEAFELEKRRVKALEKIGNSIDALTIWFEEIDKDDWSNRIQYYLSEFYIMAAKASGSISPEEEKEEEK